jgi:hypothetical protein
VLAGTVAREQLREAANGCRADAEILGETQREILFALALVTIQILHMGFAFRRNPDIWQVFRARKCKKHFDIDLKMQKCVISPALGIAGNFVVDCRDSAASAPLCPSLRQFRPILAEAAVGPTQNSPGNSG